MYLDRNDISFRQEDENDLKKENITVFRPGNRIYPENRWYIEWEVVKARIIKIPGDDKKWIAPVFSDTAELVKIKTIDLLDFEKIEETHLCNSLECIKSREDLLRYLEKIYKKREFKNLTRINMEKINSNNLIDNSQEIINLFENWTMKFAILPENNVKNLDELLNAWNFSITFINHDYAWITPKMWNYIAEKYNLDIKSSMIIIKPEDLEKCLDILQKNNKYIGWWLWVWFKDIWWKLLSEKKYWFINPIADEMQSTNFIAHFWDEIHWYNSDATWYTDSLWDKFKEIWEDIMGKNIILLWAGWTARWIALELVNRWVSKITILNRSIDKASYIADRLNSVKNWVAFAWWEDMIFDLKNEKIDAIINLSTKWADWDFVEYSALTWTNIWLEKNLETSKDLLNKFSELNKNIIISDINLTKSKTTPFLEQAREIGLNTLDWKLMVIYQWVQAIWTVFWDKIIKSGWTKEDVQKELLKLVM